MLFSPQPYLDPGSGSMLLQVLLAVALGAGVTIKLYWRKIKAFINKNKAEAVDEAGEDLDDEPVDDQVK
mgnify:CR=1 FL=1